MDLLTSVRSEDRKKLVGEISSVAEKSEAMQAATQRAKELTEPWRRPQDHPGPSRTIQDPRTRDELMACWQ